MMKSSDGVNAWGVPVYEIDFGTEGKERYVLERDFNSTLANLHACNVERAQGAKRNEDIYLASSQRCGRVTRATHATPTPHDAAVWTPEMIADIHQRGEALHARIASKSSREVATAMVERAAIAICMETRSHPNPQAYWDNLHHDEREKYRKLAFAALTANG